MIKLLGHRGYKALYPENTISAINKAFELSDGVEFDIQKSQDGKFVIIHDETIDRTSNGKGFIKEMTLQQLKEFDFGDGDRISSLDELLNNAPENKFINIELKHQTITQDDIPTLINIIKTYYDTRFIIVSSFNPALLLGFKEFNIKIGYLVGDPYFDYKILTIIKNTLKLKPNYLNLPVKYFTEYSVIKKMLFEFFLFIMNIKIMTWTVNNEEELKAVLNKSEFIITNEIEKLKILLKRS